MDPETWTTIVRDVGFPIAVSLILLSFGASIGMGCWIIARWLGRELIIPMRDAHRHFLTSIQETQQKQSNSLQRLDEGFTKLVALQELHASETEYIRHHVEAIRNGRS